MMMSDKYAQVRTASEGLEITYLVNNYLYLSKMTTDKISRSDNYYLEKSRSSCRNLAFSCSLPNPLLCPFHPTIGFPI
jgi:hypothetical protein